MRFKEILATLSVVVSIIALPLLIGWYHDNYVLGAFPEADKVITLRALGDGGVWTLDKVDGTNYWWKDFQPATIHLEKGDRVVIRFESTDVHHRFYCPELNIGPVEIEAGHIVTAEFQANKVGSYRYYCTAMCGHCHFYMQGWIVVTEKGQPPQQFAEAVPICKHHYDKPSEDDMVAYGRYLYYEKACFTCHGDEGKGNVENINYVKEEVPAHNTLADKLWLKNKEAADTFVEMLKARVDFENMEEKPDIRLFNLVLQQYYAAKDLIKKGKHCAKADIDGPEPPLQMISWQNLLTDRDIDSIIIYLITLFEWEEDEE